MNANHHNSDSKFWLVVWCAATALLAYVVFFNAVGNDRTVAVNTLCLGAFTAMLAIPMGVLTAWAASGRGLVSRVLLVTVIALLIVPVFIHVSAWDSAFGKLGWLTARQGEVLKPLLSGWSSAVWIHAVAISPQVAVIVLIGLATGRRVYEEQALLDSSQTAVFWHITVPRLLPLLLLCAIWIVVNCSREIAVTDIYRVGTLAEQIYLGFSMGQFSSVQGSWTQQQLSDAQSLGPLVTVSIIAWIVVTALWFFSRMTDFEFESRQWFPKRRTNQRNAWLQTGLALALLLILVVVPIGNLFYRASFFVTSIDGVPTPGHSFSRIANTIGRVFVQYPSEFCWSSLIALVAASLLIVLSTLATWLALRAKPWKIVFLLILTICCSVPGPLFGSLLSQVFSSATNEFVGWLYDRTIFAPVVASFFFCWPVSTLIVWFVLQKTATDCLDHAKLDGAGWLRQLISIVLPGKFIPLFGCWMISFALCFGELSTSQMVLPAGMDTIPRTTLGLLHAGVDEMTAALTIVTIGLIIVISSTGWLLIRLNPDFTDQQ